MIIENEKKCKNKTRMKYGNFHEIKEDAFSFKIV